MEAAELNFAEILAKPVPAVEFENHRWVRNTDPLFIDFLNHAYRREVKHCYERVIPGRTVTMGSQPPILGKHRLLILASGNVVRQSVKYNHFGWENAIHKSAYIASSRLVIAPEHQLWGGRRTDGKRYYQHRLKGGKFEVDQLPPEMECVFPIEKTWPPIA